MSNPSIPDTNHISRYCRPSKVDGETPQPPAFQLREEKGEDYLSVDWLEFLKEFKGGCDAAAITEALRKRGLKVSKGGRHAVFNVGDLRSYVKKRVPKKRMLDVRHVPRHEEDSHSGVYNYNHEESNFIAVLISQAIKEVLKP